MHLLFPPLCLHCSRLDRALFCTSCQGAIHFLPPLETSKDRAAAFAFQGPIRTFVHHFRERDKPFLASLGGDALALYFDALGWPLPDVVIPQPEVWIKRWKRGYHPSALLAKRVGKVLGIPVEEGLEIRGFRRREIRLKQKAAYVGKKILLIADLALDKQDIEASEEALAWTTPSRIFSLSLARRGDEEVTTD